jgi:hypothetical protein
MDEITERMSDVLVSKILDAISEYPGSEDERDEILSAVIAKLQVIAA